MFVFFGGVVCHWYAMYAVKENGKSDSGNTDHRISQKIAALDFALLMDELRWRWAMLYRPLNFNCFTPEKTWIHPSNFTTFSMMGRTLLNFLQFWLDGSGCFAAFSSLSGTAAWKHLNIVCHLPILFLWVSMSRIEHVMSCWNNKAISSQISTFWANTISASLCEIFLGAKAGATLLFAASTKRIQQETWQLVGFAGLRLDLYT